KRRRRWVIGLFAASLVVAALGGAGYAWHRRQNAEETPSTNGSMKPKSSGAEQARDRTEEWLDPERAARDPADGFKHCLERGLFFLENDRLDEAHALFTRLEAFDQKLPDYHALGQLGQAIVQALRNRPEESNEL